MTFGEMKMRAWAWVIRKQPEGCVLPQRFIVARCILFPVEMWKRWHYSHYVPGVVYEWSTDCVLHAGVRIPLSQLRYLALGMKTDDGKMLAADGLPAPDVFISHLIDVDGQGRCVTTRIVRETEYLAMRAQYTAIREQREAMIGVLFWLHGYTDFAGRPEGAGAYWWRAESQLRLAEAGIDLVKLWGGDQYANVG